MYSVKYDITIRTQLQVGEYQKKGFNKLQVSLSTSITHDSLLMYMCTEGKILNSSFMARLVRKATNALSLY